MVVYKILLGFYQTLQKQYCVFKILKWFIAKIKTAIKTKLYHSFKAVMYGIDMFAVTSFNSL